MPETLSLKPTTTASNVFPIDSEAPSFCQCSKKMIDRRLATIKVLKSTCQCGEDVGRLDWSWDTCKPSAEPGESTERSDVVFEGNLVTFHPIYSQGTAVVKGNTPLEHGRHHYWEIKIMSFLTGTDLMIGIGTDKVNIESHSYKFSSFLGLDDQTWGFSYRGLAQNQGRLKYYGRKFSRGCIIGVHLDLERGCLEFSINRKSLGVAYTNIPLDHNVQLYPMVCSTSAKTTIKLINSQSVQPSLQFHCMKAIYSHPGLLEQVKSVPGFARLCNDLWFLQAKENYGGTEFEENNILLEDEACILSKKKKKYIEELDISDSSVESLSDLYKNAHRIKHFKRTTTSSSSDDSDDDVGPFPYFCDHF